MHKCIYIYIYIYTHKTIQVNYGLGQQAVGSLLGDYVAIALPISAQLRYSMQVPKLEPTPSMESERSDRHTGRAFTAATQIQSDPIAKAAAQP